jgi:hypothetical protein
MDLYVAVRELIKELHAAGDDVSAARLEAGMDGTTGSEVIGNIGLALIDVKATVQHRYRGRVEAALACVRDIMPAFRDNRKEYYEKFGVERYKPPQK